MTDIDGYILALFIWTAVVAFISYSAGYVKRACQEEKDKLTG